MNKTWRKLIKKHSPFVGVIAIVLLLIIGSFYLASKKPERISVWGIPKVNMGADDIVFATHRDNKGLHHTYEVNLATKEVTEDEDDILASIKELDITPPLFGDDSVGKPFRQVIEKAASPDGKDLLIIVGSFAAQTSLEPFLPSPISTQEFRCNIPRRSCTPSTVLTKATERVTSEGVFFTDARLHLLDLWHAWNPETGQLFGYITGEGGSRLPVFMYDAKHDTLQTTDKAEEQQPFSGFSFDAAMKKMIIIKSPGNFTDTELWLHTSDNLSKPYTVIDNIPFDTYADYTEFTFSKQEEKILAQTSLALYSIDIASKKVTELINIYSLLPTIKDIAGWPSDESAEDLVNISPSGQYVYFSQQVDGSVEQYPVALDLHTGELIKYDGDFTFNRF